jgi:hypothetical protein
MVTPPQFETLERSFRRALENGGSELLKVVDQLLSPRPALRIGETTVTAYRKVHEILGSVLDFAAHVAADERRWDVAANRLTIELSKAKIMVNYQLARKQISQDIATLLNVTLNSVENVLRSRSRERVRELAERGRTLVDALAVFVYRFGKQR